MRLLRETVTERADSRAGKDLKDDESDERLHEGTERGLPMTGVGARAGNALIGLTKKAYLLS